MAPARVPGHGSARPAPFDVAADRPAWVGFIVMAAFALVGALGGTAMAVTGIVADEWSLVGMGALLATLSSAVLLLVPVLMRGTVTRLRWDGAQLHVAWASGRRAAFSPHDFAALQIHPLPLGARSLRLRCRDGQVIAVSDAQRAPGVRDPRAVTALIDLATHTGVPGHERRST